MSNSNFTSSLHTQLIKKHRWKTIDALFYSFYSSLLRPANFSTSSNASSTSPTVTLSHDDVSAEDIERLQLLCTVIVPCLFGIIITLAILGNVTVIGVVASQKKLRTPLNVFILNLTISDVIMVAIGLPFAAYRYAADTWNIGDVMCRLYNYALMTSIYVNVYTMVAIAAFRCKLMRRREKMNSAAGIRPAVICVILIWVLMLGANLPVYMYYGVRTSAYGGYVYISCELPDLQAGKNLFLAFFVLAYIVPLSISSGFYCILITFLHRQFRRLASFNVDSSGVTHRKYVRVTWLLVAVLAAFAVAWLPIHVQLLYAFMGRGKTDTFAHELFRVATYCMAYSSTALNPVLYCFATSDFRRAFVAVSRTVVRKLRSSVIGQLVIT